MDLYSIDKLMHETRQLAAKYRQATGSTLAVTGEIARFDVAKTLKLNLVDDMTLGHDAIGTGDREGLRILIKGRVIFEDSKSSPRIGQIKADGRWDHVVLVLFDDDYMPVEMYETTEEAIKEASSAGASGSANKKRGAMSVAQFKKIGQLVWNRPDN
ncbi:MAG: hypothetical protein Q9N32_06740 [Gammaproteobacteria bacterium]|nr:hypothetical protein [Gammaproteobacteria bacterium]